MSGERDAGRPGIPDEPRRVRDGGPAFPHADREHYLLSPGMSLRDWLAGQALAGLAARHNMEPRFYAQESYRIADAMLKESGR